MLYYPINLWVLHTHISCQHHAAIFQTLCCNYHHLMKYTSLVNHYFLEFLWYVEQLSCCFIQVPLHSNWLLFGSTIFPIKILNYNRKHLHSIIIDYIYGISTAREWVLCEHLHYIFNSMRCRYWVSDYSCHCVCTWEFSDYFLIMKYYF
jgi:hypothetical protein